MRSELYYSRKPTIVLFHLRHRTPNQLHSSNHTFLVGRHSRQRRRLRLRLHRNVGDDFVCFSAFVSESVSVCVCVKNPTLSPAVIDTSGRIPATLYYIHICTYVSSCEHSSSTTTVVLYARTTRRDFIQIQASWNYPRSLSRTKLHTRAHTSVYMYDDVCVSLCVYMFGAITHTHTCSNITATAPARSCTHAHAAQPRPRSSTVQFSSMYIRIRSSTLRLTPRYLNTRTRHTPHTTKYTFTHTHTATYFRCWKSDRDHSSRL